jgi:hypothetical protein
MNLNFKLCENFSISQIICCRRKKKKKNEEDILGKSVTLMDLETIMFDSLLPSHNEYLYLKILENGVIISVEGDFMSDIDMEKTDFIGKNISSLEKNTELFRTYITPIFKRVLERNIPYQVCFKLNSQARVFCCTIHPCTVFNSVSSVDCIVRPAVFSVSKDEIDQFAINSE